ncbi:hypothetical protein J7M00_00430 [bacterium]|nr:hypothetical protein [bacterium]
MRGATLLLLSCFVVVLSVASVYDADSFLTAHPEILSSRELYNQWKAEYTNLLRGSEGLSRAAAPMEIRVNNGYVEAVIDETTGEFDEGGDPTGSGAYMKLTYSYPPSWTYSSGTEWVMYYVDGISAKTADWSGGMPAPDDCHSSGDTIICIWENWNGTYIRQELLPVSLGTTPGESEHIRFKAVLKSADSDTHNVGCIVYYDTKLNSNDGAPISTAFGYSGVTEMFWADSTDGIPPIWHAYEWAFPPAPGDLVATGILTGYDASSNPPDIFWCGNWPSSVSNTWADADWTALIGDPFSLYNDTATMVKWYPQHITATDSVIFVTYYGLGVVGTGVHISHSPPEFSPDCGDVSPNPVEITATITNGQTYNLNNVFVVLDLGSCDLEYSGGDPNPMTFSSIAGFGGSQMVDWEMTVPPDAFGTTQCYNIIVISDEDTAMENYCVDIPDALPLIILDTVYFSEETDCDGENVLNICYNIGTCDDMPEPILFTVSADGGITWVEPDTANIRNAENDLGEVSTGLHCFELVFSEEYPDTELDNFGVRIVDMSETSEFDEITFFGAADSRHPDVSITCPPETVFFSDTFDIVSAIDDMFPVSASPESLIIYYCEGADTFIGAETPERWGPDAVFCDSAYIKITAADSFCNWSSDRCDFVIISTGDMYLSFPETTAYGCDTIDIVLKIDSLWHPLANSYDVHFTINSAVIRPVSFVPAIMPSPSSSELTGAGNNWTISMSWDDRVMLSGTELGTIRFEVLCDAMGGDYSPLMITDVESPYINSHWVNGAVLIEYAPQPWLEILRFDDLGDSFRRTTLAFGTAAGANDLYDEAFDLRYLPPPPSEVDVWFDMDDPENPAVSKLKRDIQDTIPENVWQIIINEDAALYVHWNPASFDEGIYILNGIQDMRADSDYFAAPYETLTITWNLPDIDIGNISVDAGWNLVSLIAHSPSGNPASIFPGATAGPFGYDAETGAYFIPDRVEPGPGYWVYYPAPQEFPVAGVPVYRYGLNVKMGWNLVGSTVDTVLVDDVEVVPPTTIFEVFGYDPSVESYFHADTLFPGKGYWMLINGDGVLWVPGE